MKVPTLVVILVALTGMVGCISMQPDSGNTNFPVYANAFPEADTLLVESPEQIMALPPAAGPFIARLKEDARHKHSTITDELVESVFSKRHLGVDYNSDANSPVAETFANSEANCLSLTLMAYALARKAGLDAQLQQVDIPEYWSRKQGFSVLNGHVNVIVWDPSQGQQAHRLIDFDSRLQAQQFAAEPMPLFRAIAMYYNNKAADALMAGDFSRAFRLLSEALKSDDSFASAWVNLGVLYRFNQYYSYAEQAYLRATQTDPGHLTAKENLAILYRLTGREKEADNLLAEVRHLRRENPYFHLNRGDEAFDAGDISRAKHYYRRAYRLDRHNHLVLFAMGKVAHADGEFDNALAFLERALNQARFDTDKQRYLSKLALLSNQYD
ncbi:tetratricopeptide repeat protein [Alteromonas gilva]|uniref:Tetratricopeptide repeat protein n=1 Tax=Alteromonas gilva TaxID=2987522 RepID=A0ABT5L8N4_9ALTE|nr:tetratricopeptide repeat protein [Alteromonas gilva]MDC8832238.1 tetratricopeptide repeat protein [Alteromonas gilva]